MSRWMYLAFAAIVVAGLASLYVGVLRYDDLPERLPIHWNVAGNPDGWVARDSAWKYFVILPAVMVGFLGLTFALPWLSPRQFQIDTFRGTYDYLMAIIMVLFAYLHIITLAAAFHEHGDLSRWFVAGILFFLALMGNVMGRVRRNFYVGIRTPWTLANETVWIRTHRLGAWMFTAYGVVGGVAILAGVPMLWCLIPFIAVALVPVVYSLVIYKRLEKQGKV